MWNINILERQKKNKDKYLQYKQKKRIGVQHTLMNENVTEKFTCVFNIKQHIQIKIYFPDL
jgi:hypothetical protein